uniref:Uncharacterized protein n=1 Tax=Magallana gigas TaxID=29159 RepID=K1R5G1_MAGGI
MDTPTRKRKREIQEEENDELSFVFGTCGLHLKRRKKTSKSALPFPKNGKQLPQLPARFDHHDAQNEENGENVSPSNISWKPPKVVDKAVFTPEPLRRNDTLRRSLQRRVSMKVLRKKMKKFQDYSLPYDANFKYLNHLTLSYKSQFCRACKGSKVGYKSFEISIKGHTSLLSTSVTGAQESHLSSFIMPSLAHTMKSKFMYIKIRSTPPKRKITMLIVGGQPDREINELKVCQGSPCCVTKHLRR